MELKRNIAWVRRGMPLFHADGKFAETITMNPWAIVHEGTIYLFFAGDDENGRRQIRLATAPENDPENFTFKGVVVKNSDVKGDFDYAWCVLPHVVRLPDGTFYMLYSGNCGFGAGLSSFPGLGVARSDDLIHWVKYDHNPVIRPGGETDCPLIGIAGGGLYCEDLGERKYKLHLFYTGCPTLGDNIFMDQQKTVCYSTSTDGINWDYKGVVRTRTTSSEYENIASAGGPVIRDRDGLWRSWYSAIGTRWGVYSICYSESEDGMHWNRGERYGENLALAPHVRDIDGLAFMEWKKRWQDQSVSYPSVIRTSKGYRMYYVGNDYGCGGIGTAVSAPFRIALTGENNGSCKMWSTDDDRLYHMELFSSFSTEQTGEMTLSGHMEGITHNGSVFMEEFPEKDGKRLLSVRGMVVHKENDARFDIFIENRSSITYDGIKLTADCKDAPVKIISKDADVTCKDNIFTIDMGSLPGRSSICRHMRILPERDPADRSL